MTPTTPTTPTTSTIPSDRYRATNVARAEAIKMLTLRSTWIMAGLTVIAALGVTVLSIHSDLHHSAGYYVGFDPTQQAIVAMLIAGLTGGVFGALLITGEFSSGTIRTSLAASPRRPLLVFAKVAETTLVTLLFFELLSFASFFLGQAILSGGGAPHADLASPGAFRAVAFTGTFVTLLTLLSFGFGLIFRSTAGAIAAFVAIVFVLPIVMRSISLSGFRFVPTSLLTNSIMTTVNSGSDQPIQPFGPSLGMGLMLLYATIAVFAGAMLFVRRDA